MTLSVDVEMQSHQGYLKQAPQETECHEAHHHSVLEQSNCQALKLLPQCWVIYCLLPVPDVPLRSPWKHGIIGHLHLTDALLQPGKLRLTFATNQPRCHSQDSDRSSLHSGHQDVVDFPLKASFPKPRVVCFSSLTEKHLINNRLHQLYTLTSSSNSIISLLAWTWQSAGDTTIKSRNGEVEGPNTPVLLLVPLKGLPVPRTKSLMLGFAGRK